MSVVVVVVLLLFVVKLGSVFRNVASDGQVLEITFVETVDVLGDNGGYWEDVAGDAGVFR